MWLAAVPTPQHLKLHCENIKASAYSSESDSRPGGHRPDPARASSVGVGQAKTRRRITGRKILKNHYPSYPIKGMMI